MQRSKIDIIPSVHYIFVIFIRDIIVPKFYRGAIVQRVKLDRNNGWLLLSLKVPLLNNLPALFKLKILSLQCFHPKAKILFLVQ
jgi:hypothetical protein